MTSSNDSFPGDVPGAPGSAGPSTTDTDDAIDKAKGDLDDDAVEAARRSGYADVGESEEAADDR
jgi:hypothetical protein